MPLFAVFFPSFLIALRGVVWGGEETKNQGKRTYLIVILYLIKISLLIPWSVIMRGENAKRHAKKKIKVESSQKRVECWEKIKIGKKK